MNKFLSFILVVIPQLINCQALEIGSSKTIQDFDLTPNSSHVIIAYNSGIELFDLSKKEVTHQFNDIGENIHSILLSPDSSQLYLATNNSISVMNTSSCKIKELIKLESPISKLFNSPLNHIVLGFENGELMGLDRRNDHSVVFETQTSGLISAIDFDLINGNYLISNIDGKIYQISSSGKSALIYDLKKACFDLSVQANDKTFTTVTAKGIDTFVRMGNRFDFYEHENRGTWITSISDQHNSTAFGYGSGKLVIKTPFSEHSYKFRSSIVRIELLNNGPEIQVITQTYDQRLYFLKGIQMKTIRG